MSRLFVIEVAYSKDVSSRVSQIFIILTQKKYVNRNIAEVRCDIKITKKTAPVM